MVEVDWGNQQRGGGGGICIMSWVKNGRGRPPLGRYVRASVPTNQAPVAFVVSWEWMSNHTGG